jgi:putative flippase GtrA
VKTFGKEIRLGQTSVLGELAQREGVRQFIKFCIIGVSSFVIDASIASFLVYSLNLNPTLSKAISFLFAVTNGFIWNSRWTFRGMGSGKKHEMYVKFVTVNGIGFVLNILLFKSVLWMFTGRFIGQGTPNKLHFAIAMGTAAICVAFWNFLANRSWTFKHTPPPSRPGADTLSTESL